MIISFHKLILILVFTGIFPAEVDWGFYGHRQINYYAVFTLPQEMLPLYKSQITFLSDHAVDADKRRYATVEEGPRHYIDMDAHGKAPFEDVPRSWGEAKLLYLQVDIHHGNTIDELDSGNIVESYPSLFRYLEQTISKHFYDIVWEVSGIDSLWVSQYDKIVFTDGQYEHGVLPYQFPILYRQLVNAMIDGDTYRILRYSADLGHYISDAHVPLHTTSNYNGQLTDQVGIHAFWESRIPELFAEKTYDLFVGKAKYIYDVQEFIWKTILDSHTLVDSVLIIEKRLSQSFPKDQQYCYTERLDVTVRTQCEAYAAAYQALMKGMVEERYQESIHAVGSLWYSAWVDAGQPDFSEHSKVVISEKNKREIEKLESLFKTGISKGRDHN